MVHHTKPSKTGPNYYNPLSQTILQSLMLMPYGPTHKEIKKSLMGLLTNNKYMPYGPTYKQ